MGLLASPRLRAPVAAFVALAILAGCGKKELPPKGGAGSGTGAGKPAEEISIAVAPALRTSIPRKIEFVGSLAGVEQVTLSSEIEGTVEMVRSDLGDPVRKGQVLVSLVQDEFLSGKSRRARSSTRSPRDWGSRRGPKARTSKKRRWSARRWRSSTTRERISSAGRIWPGRI